MVHLMISMDTRVLLLLTISLCLSTCKREEQSVPSKETQPPIDCPLRKQGIDPTHMRPFEDVEKYIAFLERADRSAWQKPDEVVAALGLRGDETVFDLGAGSGYFTFRLAKVLPHGKVIAADTEAEMIRHIHHKTMNEGIQNVQATLIKPDDPAAPADADLVFVCDVLHHVADRSTWLGKLVSDMKSGARLVLIEFKEGNLPEGPPESVKIPKAQMVELASKSGLALIAERADLLPYQTFLVFQKSEKHDPMSIIFHPIGVVRSPYHEQEGTPIQPVYAGGVRGTVVVFEEYLQALKDLDGFSMIWLLYDFDRAKAWKPLVTPYRDTQERGLFATRAPARPNPIGISAVKLISIQGNEIEVEGLDILDGTPVLDIKPYVPQFDSHPEAKAGWYDHNGIDRKTADERFVK
jgi:tRNA-Thr(GGU) m(6)t(6)A37 methyltransferase TsaA